MICHGATLHVCLTYRQENELLPLIWSDICDYNITYEKDLFLVIHVSFFYPKNTIINRFGQ